MAESGRGYRGVIDVKEKVFFAAILAVFLLASLLWYNYLHRPILLSPQNVFEQAFVEPVQAASAMDGGNSLQFGFDYWIKFRYSEPVHLRKASEFKPGVVEVGRSWFAEKWPHDQALRDPISSYQLLEHTEQGIGKVVHEWLLINKVRNYYCYRNWGM
jgi:hypothetical protein